MLFPEVWSQTVVVARVLLSVFCIMYINRTFWPLVVDQTIHTLVKSSSIFTMV